MGRNNADFHGVNISHEVFRGDTPSDETYTKITASHPEHGDVGHLALRNNKVAYVLVEEGHRRKGIGTAMWNYAKSQGLNPQHDDRRTEEGNAWVKAVGD